MLAALPALENCPASLGLLLKVSHVPASNDRQVEVGWPLPFKFL
jgi:hypothetical protein